MRSGSSACAAAFAFTHRTAVRASYFDFSFFVAAPVMM
jgi:hypothetical protein